MILRGLALSVVTATVVACTGPVPGTAGTEPSPGSAGTFEVQSYYGPYDARRKQRGRPASSLESPIVETWLDGAPIRPDRPYTLGVLLPNREENDAAWGPLKRGIERQAARTGVRLRLLESDGYDALEQHRQQFDELLAEGVDGIVLAAIHYNAMDARVAQAVASGVPVVAVINDVYAPDVQAKAIPDFYDMGRQAGHYVLSHARKVHRRELSVALFPGPINSGWAPDTLAGCLDVVRDFEGELLVLPPRWGNPEATEQARLVEEVLGTDAGVDYVVGNAVAAKEAANLLEVMGDPRETTIVSTYFSPALEDVMRTGQVAAAVQDHGESLGVVAVDLTSRLLAGARPGRDIPFRVSSVPTILEGEDLPPREAAGGPTTDR